MTNPLIIGIHGKPRSVKSTLARYLSARGKYNLYQYGPSVAVKDAAAAMFGVDRALFDDDNKKDVIDPYWKLTYREMAQKVGKESSRDIFGEDFWMRHVQRKWNSICNEQTLDGRYNAAHFVYNGMILADVRYANEVKWIQERAGTVIFIVRDNLPVSSGTDHAAEAGLSVALANFVIYNNGTLEELYKQVDRCLK